MVDLALRFGKLFGRLRSSKTSRISWSGTYGSKIIICIDETGFYSQYLDASTRRVMPKQSENAIRAAGAGQRLPSPHGMCELSDSPLFVDAPRRAMVSVDRKR